MKLGRTPTESEIAKGMGVEVERWRRMVGEMRTVGLLSTTVQTADDQDRTQEFPDKPEGLPDRVCARRQLRSTLARGHRRSVGAVSEGGVPVLHQRNDDEGDRGDSRRQREPRLSDPQDGAKQRWRRRSNPRASIRPRRSRGPESPRGLPYGHGDPLRVLQALPPANRFSHTSPGSRGNGYFPDRRLIKLMPSSGRRLQNNRKWRDIHQRAVLHPAGIQDPRKQA